MTESESLTPFNSASDGAHIGVQAGTIFGDVSVVHKHQSPYDLPDKATAEQRFHVGVKNLEGGKASTARRLIWDVMVVEYRTNEARFYWLIAMLSGRTIADFSNEEIFQLATAAEGQPAVADDSWGDGAHLVFQLLEAVGLLRADPRPSLDDVLKGFDVLSHKQRTLLLPHLDIFLDGSRKNDVWEKQRKQAESGRWAENRRNRAWKFFHPHPASPRLLPVERRPTTFRQLLTLWTCTVVFAGAIGFFGWELLRHGAVLGLLAYLVGLLSLVNAARVGREIRFLAERRRRKTEPPSVLRAAQSSASVDGFAAQIDKYFKSYTSRYVPTDIREAWKADTAGILKFDRDEIVTVYRETRVSAEQVAWLVRYRVRKSLADWRSGRLAKHRQALRPRAGMTAVLTVSMAVAILGGIGAVVALHTTPLADVVTVLVAVPSGLQSWRSWLGIYLERQRVIADTVERNRRSQETDKEFRRWTQKLANRPSDAEMGEWLECDRTVLLGQAIDHYKLARHQVVAHAFVEEPGTNANRARVHNGPARYSRYNLIVFLLTASGVRQIKADLLFLSGDIYKGDRTSYRYDAVASAQVSSSPRPSQRSRMQQKFQLTLVNGTPTTAIVTDIDPGEIQEGETETSLEAASFDAASVDNTLHLLEGIAAEGKDWIRARDPGLTRRET